jgi:hypothetical protein
MASNLPVVFAHSFILLSSISDQIHSINHHPNSVFATKVVELPHTSLIFNNLAVGSECPQLMQIPLINLQSYLLPGIPFFKQSLSSW